MTSSGRTYARPTVSRTGRPSVKVLGGRSLILRTGYRGTCPTGSACSFTIIGAGFKVGTKLRKLRSIKVVDVIKAGHSGGLSFRVGGAAARSLIKAGHFSVGITIAAANASGRSSAGVVRRLTVVLPRRKPAH